MKVIPYLIDGLAISLTDSDIWGQIQATVKIVEDPTKTGAEKRQACLDEITHLGIIISGFLINLLIELAVTKLKTST